MERGDCLWVYLGRVGYQEAWDLQRELARQVADGSHPDILLLLEHPPTYTLGRRGKESDLLVGRQALLDLGAAVVEVDRGGEVTYHGPGQLVGYPVIALRPRGGPIWYVRALEEALIRALGEFGVKANRQEGWTGVWADGAKIAAIGVKISRGVTTHGFALNVSTDLAYFQHIVPCGIRGRGVTSVECLLGRSIPLEEVAAVVAGQFGEVLGYAVVPLAREGLPFLASPRPAPTGRPA